MNHDPHEPAPAGDRDGAGPPDLLRAVLDSVIGFIGIMTPEGILTDVNGPAMRTSGIGREDVIGKPLWDCVWWNFEPAVQARLQDAVRRAAAGEAIRYETEVRVADDRRIVIDFLLTPHRDATGRVDFLIPSGLDITDRVRTERLLRASHDSFKNLVTRSPFGVFAVDADFRMSIVSAGAERTFRTVSPLLGRDFAEVLQIVWPEPFASETIGHFRHTLATGEEYHAASTVERRQDTSDVESYDWKLERVMLPDGRLGVICHFYDLTEREEYTAALRAEEARFRATFDNAAVGIAHVGPDGRWLLVNRKLCAILGYTEAELTKMTFQDITFAGDRGLDQERLRQILAGEIEDFEIEKRYRTKSGGLVWVNLTVSCMRAEDRAVKYFISVIEDISDQKAAERQQKLLIGELNHRVKNILSMIQAMASHTMRASRTMAIFREKFSGRLRAIAAAHDSVFRKGEMQADLTEVIRKQLAPYAATGSDRLVLSGPPVRLNAASAHALGLIVHEMATNAAKYGALSTPAGHIAVSAEPFQRDDKTWVHVTWAETGGPPVKPPAKAGFGSRLITSTLQHSLRGTSTMDYLPNGLRAEFTFEIGDTEDG
jgi:PAS domain S-box-containing protein